MQQMLSVELNINWTCNKAFKCWCVTVSIVCSEGTREHSEVLLLLPSQTAPTLSALAVPKYIKHKFSHTIAACPKWHTAHCVISEFALWCLSTFIAISSTDRRIAWANALPDDVFCPSGCMPVGSGFFCWDPLRCPSGTLVCPFFTPTHFSELLSPRDSHLTGDGAKATMFSWLCLIASLNPVHVHAAQVVFACHYHFSYLRRWLCFFCSH